MMQHLFYPIQIFLLTHFRISQTMPTWPSLEISSRCVSPKCEGGEDNQLSVGHRLPLLVTAHYYPPLSTTLYHYPAKTATNGARDGVAVLQKKRNQFAVLQVPEQIEGNGCTITGLQ